MAKDFKHPKVVENYDDHIRKLIPGYELVHLQTQAILKTRLQAQAQILIAGCGTGYELEYLIELFPEASFVAFDPSEQMIHQAQSRLKNNQDLKRVQFYVGDSEILNQYASKFDAALAILVSHFLTQTEKSRYFKQIHSSLRTDGFCLSYDLMRFQNQAQLLHLCALTQALGLSEKQSLSMVDRIDDDFHLISEQDMHQLLKNCGFQETTCFTQISNFYGIEAKK